MYRKYMDEAYAVIDLTASDFAGVRVEIAACYLQTAEEIRGNRKKLNLDPDGDDQVRKLEENGYCSWVTRYWSAACDIDVGWIDEVFRVMGHGFEMTTEHYRH